AAAAEPSAGAEEAPSPGEPDEVFLCTICSDVLCSPRMLACGHSFCRACLQRWLQRKMCCPLCNGEVAIPPMRNVALEHIIEQLH
ncbi:unnamed protein product, partial [Polarella glacialis]